jgi:hypothetical protein
MANGAGYTYPNEIRVDTIIALERMKKAQQWQRLSRASNTVKVGEP